MVPILLRCSCCTRRIAQICPACGLELCEHHIDCPECDEPLLHERRILQVEPGEAAYVGWKKMQKTEQSSAVQVKLSRPCDEASAEVRCCWTQRSSRGER